MLRVAEHWHGSDVGRQRSGNEDALFVRAPLFVLADGMGGAQAGEVASALAVEAFQDGLPEEHADRWLATRIDRANHQILRASQAEAQLQGMGTTCTTAYVGPDEVVIAHVGDSRCYLLRDGELTKLTRDHSLIGELIDRGKITDEEALTHPQRSVITRALGIERDLIVDTDRIQGREGDVFLLCSDGLTDMVREAQIAELLRAPDLPAAGRALIGAANEAGGRDNITVILFRLEEVGPRSGPPSEHDTGVTAEQAALAEEPTGEHDVVTEPRTASAPAAVPPSPVVEERPPDRSASPPAGERPKRRRRWVPVLVSLLVVLTLFGAAAFIAVRAVFFIDTDATGSVVIYRGLPYEGPFGLSLYTTDYTSGVTLQMVPPDRRETFTDRQLRSFGDAVELVEQLETGQVR